VDSWIGQSLKEWNRTQERRVTSKFGAGDPDFSPWGPGMLLHVGLQKGKNARGAFHHPAADDDKFWVISMNQSHDIRSPYPEAAIGDILRHAIALG
jgi:hypothetical protein